MRLHLLAVGLVMLCAAGALSAQDTVTLELEQVKAERDALRIQLAQAQLQIKKLENQLKQLQGDGAKPLATTITSGGGSGGDAGRDMTVTVKILSITTADPSDLRVQLAQRKKEFEDLDWELSSAKRRYDRMEWENRASSRPNSSVALGSARADVTKIENRQRNARVAISRLEEEIKEATTTRTITGEDVLSGEVIKAVAAGPAAGLAATLERDKIYTLTGRKRTLNGVTELLIRTIKTE